MNTKGLKNRIERVEKAMEPTVEEALSWVEKRNPAAGRVLRREFDENSPPADIRNLTREELMVIAAGDHTSEGLH